MMTVGAVSQADCSMRTAWIVACTAQPVEKLMMIATSALTQGQHANKNKLAAYRTDGQIFTSDVSDNFKVT